MVASSTLYIGQTGHTPLGRLWVAVSQDGLVAVEGQMKREQFEACLARRFSRAVEHAPDRIRAAAIQLEEYLSGRRRKFSLSIDWAGLRPFQQAALQATLAIPYGQMRTYHEIAVQIGHPRAARAVGRAEATNPLPLVIPCHRVIGTDGKLHGYGLAGGSKAKEWLLKMESAGGVKV